MFLGTDALMHTEMEGEMNAKQLQMVIQDGWEDDEQGIRRRDTFEEAGVLTRDADSSERLAMHQGVRISS
jgi:hypothetical protein